MSFETDAAAATTSILTALGRSVTLRPLAGMTRSFTAVFDRMTSEQAAGIGIEGERTWCEVADADATAIEHGDTISVDDADYVVVGIERDHYGLTTLLLEHSAVS